MNSLLKIDKMSFSYGDLSELIFENFSRTFENINTVFVEGNNGSGKTTFGKLVCGLLEPTFGNILVNGDSIYKYKSSKKVKFAFYIEQKNQFQFFKRSLIDEIKLTESVSGNHSDFVLYKSFFIQEHININPLELSINQTWRFLLFLSTIYEPLILFVDEIPSSSNSKNIIALKNLIQYRSDKNLLTFVSNQRYVEINQGEILQL